MQYHPEKGIVFCLIAGWSKGSFLGGVGGENDPMLFILIFFVKNYLFAQILGVGESVLLFRRPLLNCGFGGIWGKQKQEGEF